MNMLSMRRTSNLGGFDNTLAQCGEASVQAQESSQASSVKQSDKAERMSIEMEDKDTSVKKKQARAPVISVSSDSSDSSPLSDGAAGDTPLGAVSLVNHVLRIPTYSYASDSTDSPCMLSGEDAVATDDSGSSYVSFKTVPSAFVNK